jgi:hypothetical protein
MKPTNIYNESCRQYNPENMSSRQQVLYLMEKTKNACYDAEKDVALAGKTRGSASDIDFQELFDREKRLAVFFYK